MEKHYTLYVDETGLFKATKKIKLGMRVVLGVLLPGTKEEHDKALGPLFRNLAAWWPPPFHATELKAAELALRLQRTEKEMLPLFLYPLREAVIGKSIDYLYNDLRDKDKRLYKKLNFEVHRLLRCFNKSMGNLVKATGGQVFVAIEHNLDPKKSRYPAMLDALVELSLWQLANKGQNAELELVIEQRSDAQAPDIKAMQKRLVDAGARAKKNLPKIAIQFKGFSPKGDHQGLVIADFLAYIISPKQKQGKALNCAQAKNIDLYQLRTVFRDKTDRDFDLGCTDAIDMHTLLHKTLSGDQSIAESQTDCARASELLPTGVLRASVDGAQNILQSWKAWKL